MRFFCYFASVIAVYIFFHFIFSNATINIVPFKSISPSKNVQLFVYENFREMIPWEYREYGSNSIIFRFVDQLPSFEKDKTQILLSKISSIEKNFVKESQKYFYYSNVLDEEKSIFIQATVENPGKDFLWIGKHAKNLNKKIDGTPMFLSLWIRGYGQHHTLYAIFCNRNYKSIPIYMGKLNFKGWRRMELLLHNLSFRIPKSCISNSFVSVVFKIQSSDKLSEKV